VNAGGWWREKEKEKEDPGSVSTSSATTSTRASINPTRLRFTPFPAYRIHPFPSVRLDVRLARTPCVQAHSTRRGSCRR
jgi:hypothetical protein